MCYDTGTLQAYLDGEIKGTTKTILEQHVGQCPACQQALAGLRENQLFADEKITAELSSSSSGDLSQAWTEFKRKNQAVAQEKGVGKNMLRKYRPLIAAAVAVAVVGVSLSFSSVRAGAAELLSIFRVNQFKTVTIDPADLNKIEQGLRRGEGKVDIGQIGKVEFSNKVTPGPVSLEEAKAAVDFPLALPANLPEGSKLDKLYKSAGGTTKFTLDINKVNPILQGLGSTKLLPADLNGHSFTIKVPTSIGAQYTGATNFNVVEARSPELIAPSNTEVNQIRDALLSLPFIPDNLRQQVAAINDWQHTFLVPSVNGSSQNVSVAGVQGVFITPPANVGPEHEQGAKALVWQKDNVLYAIIGDLTVDQAISIANSLR